MHSNHNIDISDFTDNINLLKNNGFKPIGVSYIYGDNVYIFETEEEADKAYHTFEVSETLEWIGDISGWWFSKDDFAKEVINYESDRGVKVLIYWL